MDTPKAHIGRKISRIRELKGMKQEALAQAMGVSQQTVSNIENSEELDEVRLKEVAEALGVSLEAIRNFSEEAVISFITNFYDNSTGPAVNFQCTFNPLDKVIELYERLAQAEKERADAFEKVYKKD